MSMLKTTMPCWRIGSRIDELSDFFGIILPMILIFSQKYEIFTMIAPASNRTKVPPIRINYFPIDRAFVLTEVEAQTHLNRPLSVYWFHETWFTDDLLVHCGNSFSNIISLISFHFQISVCRKPTRLSSGNETVIWALDYVYRLSHSLTVERSWF